MVPTFSSASKTAAIVAAGLLALAACSSSGKPSATTATAPVVSLTNAPSVPAVPTTTASGGAGSSANPQDVAAIKTTWVEFFDGKTSATRKVALLQNGQQLAQVITAQAGSAIAQQVKATVTSVTMTAADKATVVYSISIAGQEALANQTGTAVREGGQWKVGLASFCGLLQLQGSTPPQCSAAGSSASPSAS